MRNLLLIYLLAASSLTTSSIAIAAQVNPTYGYEFQYGIRAYSANASTFLTPPAVGQSTSFQFPNSATDTEPPPYYLGTFTASITDATSAAAGNLGLHSYASTSIVGGNGVSNLVAADSDLFWFDTPTITEPGNRQFADTVPLCRMPYLGRVSL
jgi:hypothetical protein